MSNRFPTRGDLQVLNANDPNRPYANLHLAIFETAINDAQGTGMFGDWVIALDARDWLRFEGFDHLQGAKKSLPAPTDEQYRHFIEGLERLWFFNSTGPIARNDLGPIEANDVAEAQVRGRVALARYARDLDALKWIADEDVRTRREIDVEGRIENTRTRLDALERIIERRGVSNV